MTQPTQRRSKEAEEIRCTCGQLLARWYPDGIQIKCKRCRRLVNIPFSQIRGSPRSSK